MPPSEGLRRFDGPTNEFGLEFVYLGDAILEPVSEELERGKTVVYVHPMFESMFPSQDCR
jgi:hypothetical protein